MWPGNVPITELRPFGCQCAQGWGYSHVSLYVGLGLASTVYPPPPQKKKYQEK